ncbi:endonuclease/exonuclease/phosphatase family protein [Microbacteriaceae bacterium VKM Ac-2855]|nr:endonuclease/exonuclease/phosphatase family protein [Microbacteriaceae bacterium VKM Ac-2855]
MGTRLVKLIVAAVVAATLLVLAWPQFFSLERQEPFAQLVSFRLATAIGAVVVAALIVLLAILTPAVRRFALVLAAMGLVFALGVTATQAVRGYASDTPRPHRLGDVRLLSWNTQHDTVAAEDIATLVLAGQADVVALQETTPETVQAVAAALAAAGRGMTALSAPSTEDPTLGTGLLISSALGSYSVDASSAVTAEHPSVIARSDTPGAPVFVSAHASAPTQNAMSAWRSDLTRIAALCAAEDDVIVLGDLNSTVDHWSALPGSGDLGDCADAGVGAGGGAVGTWPAAAPTWLGAAIDHVVYSGRWNVSGYQVPGPAATGDHRPILAQLSVQRMTKTLQ